MLGIDPLSYYNENISNNESNEKVIIEDNTPKKILFNLVNEIILGTFNSSKNLKNDFVVINTNNILFKQYYTYNQNKGYLCGFHSLFNIYYFLQYLITKENKFLFYLNNSWSFWSFYKESIKFLLNNLHLEEKAKESLLNEGPLERYQFIYLLNEFPKIKNIFEKNKNNYEISFTKFLYGFGIFNGTTDEAIDFNEKMKNFIEQNNDNINGGKEKILIILLGIVNHWNILIFHKDINNKINIFFLDSRNSPEIFDTLNLYDCNEINNENKLKIEKLKQNYIQKEIDKRNKQVNNWYITCLKEWYDSMNQSIILIFKIFQKKLDFIYYLIDNKINLLINSFINKTNIDLNKDNNIYINDEFRNKIWSWIKEEYHPAYFKDNIINDLNKTKILYNEKNFINWIKVMNTFLNKEINIKKIEENKKDIIKRYQKEISEIKF